MITQVAQEVEGRKPFFPSKCSQKEGEGDSYGDPICFFCDDSYEVINDLKSALHGFTDLH
jgi:hypothetical protein